MKDVPKRKEETQKAERPDPALKRLEKLVGTWNLKGRTLDSRKYNILGWSTFDWLPGEFFLKSFGEISFRGFSVTGLEIIGYDQKKKTFSSTVYSNLSGEAHAYEWNVQGNSIVHSGLGWKYSGVLSNDGNTLTGSWRPDKGTKDVEGNSYDAVMTRKKRKTKPRSRSNKWI